MREAIDIIKDRKIIEEKLTQSEIEYNKISYKKKTLKLEVKKIIKEMEDSTPEGIEALSKGQENNIKNLDKENSKLIKLLSTNYDDSNLKKSHIFDQKQKIKIIKNKIKLRKKKIKHYENLDEHRYDHKIEFLNAKIANLKTIKDEKKEIRNNFRKEYKKLIKEWRELFPDINESVAISVKNLNIFFGNKQAIKDISIDFYKNEVIAIIGPSGCGKSTFLKSINRINDEISGYRAEGEILLENEMDVLTLKNIHDSSDKITLPELRTKIGMVFQQPNPFPMSIFNNVAYGPRINGIKNKSVLKEIVDESLKKSAIYEQVKDNLNAQATGLSGGQQQRLCIARAIANIPNVLLMDEPTSALDPIAADKVEKLILELKKEYTIIMVTHSMQQAARISDRTAFLYQGELIEYGETKKIFKNPKESKTSDYINGKFG